MQPGRYSCSWWKEKKLSVASSYRLGGMHKVAGACKEGWAVEIFIYCKILGQCSASFALFSCKGYMWGGVTILSYSSYFVGDRENIPDYGRARCSAGNKLDPQLETGKVSSHGQVRKIS